jgi:hypothetical protein
MVGMFKMPKGERPIPGFERQLRPDVYGPRIVSQAAGAAFEVVLETAAGPSLELAMQAAATLSPLAVTPIVRSALALMMRAKAKKEAWKRLVKTGRISQAEAERIWALAAAHVDSRVEKSNPPPSRGSR